MMDRKNGLLAKLGRDKYLLVCLFLIALFIQLYGSSLTNVNAPQSADIQGHDYVSFYAAATLTLNGYPERAYDWPSQRAMQKEIAKVVKGGDGYRGYSIFAYPPNYLTIVTPFAAFPYQVSLFSWIGMTAAVYLAAVYSITLSWRSLVFATAYPGALATLIYGQNAFLTAGLIGLGLSKLNRHPWLAGFLIGALCFKPQLGLAFPIVLLASSRWTSFFSAALTAIASVALSIVLFGVKAWEAMLGATTINRSKLLDSGAMGFEQIQSLFGALRYFDSSIGIAYTAQGALVCSIAIGLVYLWRSPAAYEDKAAGCIAGTLLMSPFVLPYDLLAVIPEVAFLAARGWRDGFRRYERAVLALVTVAPVACMLALKTPVFLVGPAGVMLLFAWTVNQARQSRRVDAERRMAQTPVGGASALVPDRRE